MAKRILIVDDAGSMRGLVAMTLRGNGYDVVEAVDGVDAIGKLKSEVKFDLIFSDLNMPNMNGIELIRAVKAESAFKFIPIVMLTTVSDDAKKVEGQQAGAKAWIVKPFKPETLVGVAKKIVG
ncbi:MAG: response regulator [Candidatus Riflebacteria bacterium]|nr:response regulator [Candidatus Riflebacteria bacterium]